MSCQQRTVRGAFCRVSSVRVRVSRVRVSRVSWVGLGGDVLRGNLSEGGQVEVAGTAGTVWQCRGTKLSWEG